ncbi:hypothetical protein JNJ66_06270 [Candidatus Saccharibacteria bacterium]|nr:hypothetical protein [Candidatus Saccharibacteria bacterium]
MFTHDQDLFIGPPPFRFSLYGHLVDRYGRRGQRKGPFTVYAYRWLGRIFPAVLSVGLLDAVMLFAWGSSRIVMAGGIIVALACLAIAIGYCHATYQLRRRGDDVILPFYDERLVALGKRFGWPAVRTMAQAPLSENLLLPLAATGLRKYGTVIEQIAAARRGQALRPDRRGDG